MKGYFIVEIPNLKIANSQLYNYKTPFKGEAGNTVSNPINTEIKPEIVSKEYADATKATAMAQILAGGDLKPGMTYMDYVDKLIKKGKIQGKDFFIEENPTNSYGKSSTWIKELNPKGQRIKETIFWSEPEGSGVEIRLYDPKTQEVYKALEMQNGKLHIAYNDKNGKALLDEVYRSGGSLERNAVYKKCGKCETSGDYNITGIELPPVD